MSEGDVPHTVETILDTDGTTDVTSEYEDVIDTLVPLAHNRSTPVPIRHVLAYTEDDSPHQVFFSFTIDANQDIFGDSLYGFEIGIDGAVADSFCDDDVDNDIATEREIVFDSFSRLVRRAEEAIWNDVVNTNGNE